jgi:hypothetical protein
MSTFGITAASSQNDLVGAVNYALNNIGQGLTVNKENGQILAPGNEIPYAYAYPYLYIAFADSADGTLNFTQSSYTNRQYYGLWNTPNLTPGGSQNPAQYIWYQVQGGFDTTKGLYYQIFGQNQVQFIIDTLSPEPQGYYSEPYTLRLYQFIDPNQRGINLVETTNATNLEYSGVLTASPINLFALDNNSPNGKPAWTPAGQIQVDGADRILVNSITPDNIYYFAQLLDPVSFGDYNPVETGFNLYYIEPISGPNTLYSPNYATTGTITLDPLTAQPTYYSTGTIAMADAVNWDPATYSTTTPYLAVYNGTTWVALG